MMMSATEADFLATALVCNRLLRVKWSVRWWYAWWHE
jgi:hypothetical protein